MSDDNLTNEKKRLPLIRKNLPRIHTHDNLSFKVTVEDWKRGGGNCVYINGTQALPKIEKTKEDIKKVFDEQFFAEKTQEFVCDELKEYVKNASNQGNSKAGGFLDHSHAVTKEYFSLHGLFLTADQDRCDYIILDKYNLVYIERFNINGYLLNTGDLFKPESQLAMGVTVSTINFDPVKGITHQLAYDKIILLNKIAETNLFNRDLGLYVAKQKDFANQLTPPMFFDDDTLLHTAYNTDIDEVREGLNQFCNIVAEKGVTGLAEFFTVNNVVYPSHKKISYIDQFLVADVAKADEIILMHDKRRKKDVPFYRVMINFFDAMLNAISDYVKKVFGEEKKNPPKAAVIIPDQPVKKSIEQQGEKIILPPLVHQSRLFSKPNVDQDGVVTFVMEHQGQLQEEMQAKKTDGLYAAMSHVFPDQAGKAAFAGFIQHATFSFAGNFSVKMTREQTELFRQHSKELQKVVERFERKGKSLRA